MNEKQRAVVESAQLTEQVNAILGATVKYYQGKFPNAAEIERNIEIEERPNSYCKVGTVTISGINWAGYMRVEFVIGFCNGKKFIRMHKSFRNDNEISYRSYSEIDTATKSAIIAIANAN